MGQGSRAQEAVHTSLHWQGRKGTRLVAETMGQLQGRESSPQRARSSLQARYELSTDDVIARWLMLLTERVYLLCHILRLVIQPEDSRHQAIQKVNLDVKKLDEITMEALSTFFTDKENPNNENKRPYLRDIFKVAKQEERFKRGEIGGCTLIPCH